MKKVILCGTHPEQFNGYSKVVYELSRYLSSCVDIKLYIYGFQNFYDKNEHRIERKLPDNVEIYDVYANENPKAKGFGENLINDYILRIQPDIVIIYNDLLVINSLFNKIKELPIINFRIIPYIDLVYKNEKQSLLMNINSLCDSAIMFTEYWQTVASYQGFTKPTYVLEHGFNSEQYYPIPKKLARKFFNIPEDDFVIVNLNRNQPRKRWDICLMSYVKFISKHIGEKIKLLIATSMNGGWEFNELILSECRKYNINIQDFHKHIIILQNPQQITDFEINVLYNVGDVGINTCDGEGFGLCNFEQAGVGIAQIVPNIGGFKDFFVNNENSLLINPSQSYYCDHGRDYVGGEPEVCSVDDFIDGCEYYYKNRDLLTKHGYNARKSILKDYRWKDIGKKLYDLISKETDILRTKMKCIENSGEDITVTTLDINDLLKENTIDENKVEIILGDKKINEVEITQEDKKISNISSKDVEEMSYEEMKKMLKNMVKTL